jgi:hypothetical protein
MEFFAAHNKVVELRCHRGKDFRYTGLRQPSPLSRQFADRQGADNHVTDGVTSAIPRSSCERE